MGNYRFDRPGRTPVHCEGLRGLTASVMPSHIQSQCDNPRIWNRVDESGARTDPAFLLGAFRYRSLTDLRLRARTSIHPGEYFRKGRTTAAVSNPQGN